MRRKEFKGRLAKRPDSRFWQVDYNDWLTGKRTRQTLKTEDYGEALLAMQRVLAANGIPHALTLEGMLHLYKNPDTNPRNLQSKVEGGNYSYGWAKQVQHQAERLDEILKQDAPILLHKKVDEITRVEVKAIRTIIVKHLGLTRKAQVSLRVLKAMFSQAEDDGLVASSVARHVHDIRYEAKTRYAIDQTTLSTMVSRLKPHLDFETWAFFTIAATTGMRAGEILALSKEQLFGDTLTVNRNLKLLDDGRWGCGSPKWGIERVIPLSRTTLRILSMMPTYEDGRFFKCATTQKGKTACNGVVKACREVLPDLAPQIEKMTPHILRHSLNTNLLVGGVSPMLVEEYLGWKHQTLPVMQQNYTHVFVQALKPVCDRIDQVFYESAFGERLDDRPLMSLVSNG